MAPTTTASADPQAEELARRIWEDIRKAEEEDEKRDREREDAMRRNGAVPA